MKTSKILALFFVLSMICNIGQCIYNYSLAVKIDAVDLPDPDEWKHISTNKANPTPLFGWSDGRVAHVTFSGKHR